MSFVNTYPYTQEWSSSSHRQWTGREEVVDAPVGPMNWDDWNMQLSMMSDLCQNQNHRALDNQLLPLKCEKNKFEIRLDVSHYSPEEFSVKIVDKDLVIECKHEEKKDNYGWISRQFSRRFALPEDVDIEKVRSTLSSTGILSVEVPKKVFQTKEENVIFIPIIQEKEGKDSKDSKDQKKSEATSDGQPKTEKTDQKTTEKEKKTEILIEVKK